MANQAISTSAIDLNNAKKFIASNAMLQFKQKQAPRLYMVGAPGTGKSDLMREICQENGWGLAVRYISNVSIEQVTGLPTNMIDKPENQERVMYALWTCPEIFNFSRLEHKPEGYVEGATPTILLLDDFHLCDKMMQKYMFQLLTYMGLNGYSLPEKTAIILAGNRSNDKAGAMPIPAPVCNRMMFIEVKSSAEDWLKNFAHKSGLRDDICTFINSRGDTYLSSTPIETSAWASPRSWTYLSYQMDAHEELYGDISIDDLKIMADGLLGSEVASEFILYRELFSKWSFDEFKRMDWKAAKRKLQQEAEANPTNVYAIINSGLSWAISTYKADGYKKTERVVDNCKFLYKVLCLFITTRLDSARATLSPMVIAGVTYLVNSQKATTPAGKKPSDLLDIFISCMEEEHDYDWLFYDMCAKIFDMKLSEEEIAKVEEAREKLHHGGVEI